MHTLLGFYDDFLHWVLNQLSGLLLTGVGLLAMLGMGLVLAVLFAGLCKVWNFLHPKRR